MSRPTLSLCILTKDSGSRMRDLLLDGRRFADEIVVGADAASSDEPAFRTTVESIAESSLFAGPCTCLERPS